MQKTATKNRVRGPKCSGATVLGMDRFLQNPSSKRTLFLRRMKFMKQMKEDIFSLLKADHRKVESIFAKLESTTERATATRQKLFEQLRNELAVHTEGEEKGIYPALKENPVTKELGFESVEEHAIVKFLLSKLNEGDPASPEFTAQITALKEAVEHHVEEEETELFPKMKKAFSKEELQDFANRFQEVKMMAKEALRQAA
jgi:hemerythrin-like domain-containing protein